MKYPAEIPSPSDDEALKSQPSQDGLRGDLVCTKLMVPHLAAGLIDRPRLSTLLQQGANKRMVVVESPSGFGKTTLAAAWAHSLRETGHCVAWLTVDEHDDELVRFLSYLSGALESVLPPADVDGTSRDVDTPMLSTGTVLGRLINVLSRQRRDSYLFIDGYHFLQQAPIHEAVRYLLKHAPDNFHLVVTSCAQLPFSLAPLRGRGDLLDIDASRLSFDLAETQRLMEKTFGETPPASAVRLLLEKTGGWAAALRIAVQTVEDPNTGDGRAFNSIGTSRHIGEYLSVIWEELSPEMRDFMLKTSILDRLTAPLCEVVTGRSDAHSLLNLIACKHLLLSPLDEEGAWFGYHLLMANYLRSRLKREQPGQLQFLHRKASAWYSVNGNWTAAIEHAIAADDLGHAAAMFECCAVEKMRSGDLLTVIGWYRRFPVEVTRYSPRVRLAIAWAHLLAGRDADARAMLDAVEKELSSSPIPDREASWEWGIIYAGCAASLDDSVRALKLGGDGLELVADDPWLADAAGNAVRYGYLHAGDFKAALALPWFSNGGPTDIRTAYPAYFRHFFLGVAALKQLHLAEARRHVGEIESITQHHFGDSSFERVTGQVLAAEVLYSEGNAAAAQTLLEQCTAVFDQANELPPLDAAISASRTMIRLTFLSGNIDHALAQVDRTIAIGQKQNRARLVAIGIYERFRIRLTQQDWVDAEACIERLATLVAQHPVQGRCAWSDIHDLHALATAALAATRGNHAEAIAILAPLTDEARSLGYVALQIPTGLLLASALLDSGHELDAGPLVRELIALAAATGAIQPVLDSGANLAGLLPLYARTAQGEEKPAAHADFVNRLYAAITPAKSASAQDADVKPGVSPRELDILVSIADGLSNKEIARQLGIAPETVKSHVKSIFTKLHITRRTQAVAWLKGR